MLILLTAILLVGAAAWASRRPLRTAVPAYAFLIPIGGVISLLLSGGFGFYYAYLATARIRRIDEAAREVAEGNFATRLPVGLSRHCGWGDTAVSLDGHSWMEVFTNTSYGGSRLSVAELLRTYPVALLVKEQ